MIDRIIDLIRDTSFPDEDRHWIVPCWAGALMACIFWFTADQIYQANWHGELFGFPKFSFTSFLVSVTIGCLVGAAGGWGERRWRSRYLEGTRSVAQDLGFDWLGSAETHRAPTRRFPMLADWHKGERLMVGERDGVEVQVFDFTSIRSDVDGTGYSHSTVVLLPAEGLPEFDLVRRRLLTFGNWAGLEFRAGGDMSARDVAAIDEFNRMYAVYCGFTIAGQPPKASPDAERTMLQFMTPTVMQALVAYPNWWVETRADRMALSLGRGFRPPRERVAMIDQALGIRRILLQQAGELKESITSQ